MITFKQFLKDDVFADKGELKMAVNTATQPRASEPNRINTNVPHRLRATTTGGAPVFYAFSYVGHSTEILNSIKGKGPYTVDDVRRHTFLEETAEYVASNLKRAKLEPDVLTAPKSSSGLLHEFAQILADKLGVKNVHLAAYHKKEHKLPADKALALEYIKKHFIDHAMLDVKYHDDETREDFEDQIAKGLYSKLKDGGVLDAKKVYKPHAKFVKGYYDLGDLDDTLDGKNVLVVDDIQSTGSTMSDVFRIARDLGAAKVYGAVIFNRTTASH